MIRRILPMKKPPMREVQRQGQVSTPSVRLCAVSFRMSVNMV